MDTASAESLKQTKSAEVLENIEKTQPLLQNMAEQILDTEPDRWNVLIGDDTGGRLPAHFVHKLMKLDGRDMQTYFVANSGPYRVKNGTRPYREYFGWLKQQVGEPLRPLIVTESVASGAAVDFLRECLEPYSSQQPEVASVAVAEQSIDKVDFIGGAGPKEIKAVWRAFESPPAKLSLGRRAVRSAWKHVPDDLKASIKGKTAHRITPPSANETVGIYVDVKRQIPIANAAVSRDGAASTKAYRLMDELAVEVYDAVRAGQHITAV